MTFTNIRQHIMDKVRKPVELVKYDAFVNTLTLLDLVEYFKIKSKLEGLADQVLASVRGTVYADVFDDVYVRG